MRQGKNKHGIKPGFVERRGALVIPATDMPYFTFTWREFKLSRN